MKAYMKNAQVYVAYHHLSEGFNYLKVSTLAIYF